MNKTLLAMLLCATLPAQAATLSLAIDVSASNPLISHPNFADSAGRFVAARIETLKPGDTVRIQTLGSPGDPSNIRTDVLQISRRLRPQKAAVAVLNYIRSLPKREDVAQSSTNLLRYLEYGSGFDCANQGQIILLTDGLESSEWFSGHGLLDGTRSLPAAEVDLSGCTLTMYGLGAGLSGPAVKHLRNAWRNWSEQAGVTFEAVIP